MSVSNHIPKALQHGANPVGALEDRFDFGGGSGTILPLSSKLSGAAMSRLRTHSTYSMDGHSAHMRTQQLVSVVGYGADCGSFRRASNATTSAPSTSSFGAPSPSDAPSSVGPRRFNTTAATSSLAHPRIVVSAPPPAAPSPSSSSAFVLAMMQSSGRTNTNHDVLALDMAGNATHRRREVVGPQADMEAEAEPVLSTASSRGSSGSSSMGMQHDAGSTRGSSHGNANDTTQFSVQHNTSHFSVGPSAAVAGGGDGGNDPRGSQVASLLDSFQWPSNQHLLGDYEVSREGESGCSEEAGSGLPHRAAPPPPTTFLLSPHQLARRDEGDDLERTPDAAWIEELLLQHPSLLDRGPMTTGMGPARGPSSREMRKTPAHGNHAVGDDADHRPVDEDVPLSLLLRRRSSLFPKQQTHQLPDEHPSCCEHADDPTVSFPSLAISAVTGPPDVEGWDVSTLHDDGMPSPSSPKDASGIPVRRRASMLGLANQSTSPRVLPQEYHYALSPEVQQAYPPNLMLWRHKLSRSASSVAAQKHASTPMQVHVLQREERSPDLTQPARSYHHQPPSLGDDDDDTTEGVPRGVTSVPCGHAASPARGHSHTTPFGPTATSAMRLDDQQLLRDHQIVMDHQRNVLAHSATLRLERQLRHHSNESAYRRGRLTAMNAATEARLSALRQVALERQLSTIFSQESSARADISATAMCALESTCSQCARIAISIRRSLVSDGAHKGRQLLLSTEEALWIELMANCAAHHRAAQRLEHLRKEIDALMSVHEPHARCSRVVDVEQQACANLILWARASVVEVRRHELLQDEARERELVHMLLAERNAAMLAEVRHGYDDALRRQTQRETETAFLKRQAVLVREEHDVRLGEEAAERRECRALLALHDTTCANLRSIRALTDREAVERHEHASNEARSHTADTGAFLVGIALVHQRVLGRNEREQRASVVRLEDEERHELAVAERRDAWESEEACRRRIALQVDALRQVHHHERDTLVHHVEMLMDMLTVQEHDVRDTIRCQFQEIFQTLVEKQRATERQRFLQHQADQRAAFCAVETDGRVGTCEFEATDRVLMQRAIDESLAVVRLRESESTMRLVFFEQEAQVFQRDILSELGTSLELAQQRQASREAKEAELASVRALRQRAAASTPFLGFSLAEKIATSSADKRLVNAAGIANLVVDSLIINGPAFTEGLRLHDRIVSVGGGIQPTSLAAVRQAIGSGAAPGQTFEIVVKRRKPKHSGTRSPSLDEEGNTLRSIDDLDFDDDAVSVTSSTSQQGSLSRANDNYEVITFSVPVRTVLKEFKALRDMYFEMDGVERIERQTPTPGYTTRSKRAFAEKLSPAGGARARAQTFAGVASAPLSRMQPSSHPGSVVRASSERGGGPAEDAGVGGGSLSPLQQCETLVPVADGANDVDERGDGLAAAAAGGSPLPSPSSTVNTVFASPLPLDPGSSGEAVLEASTGSSASFGASFRAQFAPTQAPPAPRHTQSPSSASSRAPAVGVAARAGIVRPMLRGSAQSSTASSAPSGKKK